MMTVLEAINFGDKCLKKAGIENARLETEMLLAESLGFKRTHFYLDTERKIDETDLISFKQKIKERSTRKPLQHILGTQQFRKLLLKVSPRALIPRPETELLVEHVLRIARSYNRPLKVIDVGTGSGAIALSLASELSEVFIYALDISKEALKLASENALTHGLSEKVLFIESDLFSNLTDYFDDKIDIIVSNPPYIPQDEIENLQEEVCRFEPLIALDGGASGLEIISRIIKESPEYLSFGGCLALEVGFGQAEKVAAIFKQTGCFDEVEIFPDYASIERFVIGFRNENSSF